MNKFFALGLMLVCSALGLSVGADAQERTSAFDTVLKAAQSEQSLNLIWGPSLGASAGVRALQDGLNKKYGTSITLNFTLAVPFRKSKLAGRPLQTCFLAQKQQ